ncbi:MAG: hypothetical protein HXY27_08415 [Hydrogenophilaceae bacterium]|nr:hypothetical protein [Hydrogenophilaceae bacterium]
MKNPITLVFTLLALALPSAHAWQAGEFFNGMPRPDVEEALKSWKFGKITPLGSDMILAQDPIDQPGARNYEFQFCNDKLVGFEQLVKPSFQYFITIAGNYTNQYGNALYTMPYTKIVASGPISQLAIFWRKGTDFIGVRYLESTLGDQLRLSWQVNNSCWSAPR